MKQRWAGLGFFHWEFDPEEISALLPSGLHVDTFAGKAYIGIVPFFMHRVRPVGMPPLPWLSWFHEMNVRTYVFNENGDPGVWFFSLDCNQPLAVEIALRTFHLPYRHASMGSSIVGKSITYRSLRKNSPHPHADFHYPLPESTKPAEPGTLEWFLVERYLLFSADKNGTIHTGRVHHSPYQIQALEAATCSTVPFALNGFSEPSSPPVSMLCAAPVDVAVFPLKKA